MRLSEAIRLGAMLHPQNFGCFYKYRDQQGRFCNSSTQDAEIAASCALGAAWEAGSSICDAVDAPEFDCPACLSPFERRPFASMVIHLNDRHRWTRERIADWVESHERSEVPETVAAVDPAGERVTS